MQLIQQDILWYSMNLKLGVQKHGQVYCSDVHPFTHLCEDPLLLVDHLDDPDDLPADGDGHAQDRPRLVAGLLVHRLVEPCHKIGWVSSPVQVLFLHWLSAFGLQGWVIKTTGNDAHST